MGRGGRLLEGCFLRRFLQIVKLDSHASARLKSFWFSTGTRMGLILGGWNHFFEFVAYGKAPLGEMPFRRGRTLVFFSFLVTAEGGW